VSFAHCSGGPCNLINWPPEGFQDFPINLSNSIDKVEGVFWKTLRNMSSKMLLSYSWYQGDPVWNFQVGTLFYSSVEMDAPLAGNIIDGDYP